MYNFCCCLLEWIDMGSLMWCVVIGVSTFRLATLRFRFPCTLIAWEFSWESTRFSMYKLERKCLRHVHFVTLFPNRTLRWYRRPHTRRILCCVSITIMMSSTCDRRHLKYQFIREDNSKSYTFTRKQEDRIQTWTDQGQNIYTHIQRFTQWHAPTV